MLGSFLPETPEFGGLWNPIFSLIFPTDLCRRKRRRGREREEKKEKEEKREEKEGKKKKREKKLTAWIQTM